MTIELEKMSYRSLGQKNRLPRWTPEEDEILKRDYPSQGAEAVADLLPLRTKAGVKNRAWILRIALLPSAPGYNTSQATKNAHSRSAVIKARRVKEERGHDPEDYSAIDALFKDGVTTEDVSACRLGYVVPNNGWSTASGIVARDARRPENQLR